MRAAISRREVLGAAASAIFARSAFGAEPRLRIGVMDGIAGYAFDPKAIDVAAELGLKGVQITLGPVDASGNLRMRDPKLQEAISQAAKSRGIALPNTYLDQLHRDCLKNDPETALKWIAQGIEINKALGAPVLMLVFFGKCAVEKQDEQQAVVEPLKRASKLAEDAGITLGFENTISGPANESVLDRVKSPALKVWYDIGNSTNIGHFDVPTEIRHLGRERICAFHIKDKTYLDAGAVRVKEALEAIRDIQFDGWAMLETSAPTNDKTADLRKNFEILRGDMAAVGISA